jgi:hypothetical protein
VSDDLSGQTQLGVTADPDPLTVRTTAGCDRARQNVDARDVTRVTEQAGLACDAHNNEIAQQRSGTDDD